MERDVRDLLFVADRAGAVTFVDPVDVVNVVWAGLDRPQRIDGDAL